MPQRFALTLCILLAIAVSVWAVDFAALTLDPASARGKLLRRIGLQTTPCTDLLAEMQAGKCPVIIADANPATLKLLAANSTTVKAFTTHGGWLMLWGVTPKGLADFNTLVGLQHLIRPFVMEAVGLRTPVAPLARGLVEGDVVMMSSQKTDGWAAPYMRAEDAWSYVLDIDDIAPFSTFPPGEYWRPGEPDYLIAAPGTDRYPRNMVNGLYSSWQVGFTIPLGKPEYTRWNITFPREETVCGFSLVPDIIYNRISKMKLSFTDSTAPPVEIDVKPELTRQDYTFPATRTSGLLVEITQTDDHSTGKVTGIRNLWITVKRPDDFFQRMFPFFTIGVMNAYPQGAGGIVVNEMKAPAQESNPDNAEKKLTILARLFHNLGAPFTPDAKPYYYWGLTRR